MSLSLFGFWRFFFIFVISFSHRAMLPLLANKMNILLLICGGFRGGRTDSAPDPFGRRTDAVTYGHVS